MGSCSGGKVTSVHTLWISVLHRSTPYGGVSRMEPLLRKASKSESFLEKKWSAATKVEPFELKSMPNVFCKPDIAQHCQQVT